MIHRNWFVAVLAFAGLLQLGAQTTGTEVQPAQIEFPASSTGELLGAAAAGTTSTGQVIKLGSNLSITGGVLNVTIPPQTQPALPTFVTGETYQLTVAHPTIQLAAAGATNASNLQVWRNGILQAVGVDYTYSAGVVTFLATSIGIPQPGEIIQFAYQVPPATVSAQAAKKVAGLEQSEYLFSIDQHQCCLQPTDADVDAFLRNAEKVAHSK